MRAAGQTLSTPYTQRNVPLHDSSSHPLFLPASQEPPPTYNDLMVRQPTTHASGLSTEDGQKTVDRRHSDRPLRIRRAPVLVSISLL